MDDKSELTKAASQFPEDFFDKVGIEENGQLVLKAGKTAEAKGITEKDVDADQLAKGIKVEMEHTDDKAEAKKIALDHLAELPDYYTRLAKMEREGKASTKVGTAPPELVKDLEAKAAGYKPKGKR